MNIPVPWILWVWHVMLKKSHFWLNIRVLRVQSMKGQDVCELFCRRTLQYCIWYWILPWIFWPYKNEKSGLFCYKVEASTSSIEVSPPRWSLMVSGWFSFDGWNKPTYDPYIYIHIYTCSICILYVLVYIQGCIQIYIVMDVYSYIDGYIWFL